MAHRIRGQYPRDYGWCHACYVHAGYPCWDRRFVELIPAKKPHIGREWIGH